MDSEEKAPAAAWTLLALLPFLWYWRFKQVPDRTFHTVMWMTWADIASCYLQDLLIAALLCALFLPLLKRGRRWQVLAVLLANLALIAQMLDLRCRLLFLQPLTFRSLFETFANAAEIRSSIGVFISKRFLALAMMNLVAFNVLPLLARRLSFPRRLAPWALACAVLAAAGAIGAKPQPYHLDDQFFAAPAIAAARRLIAAAPPPDLSDRCDEPARLLPAGSSALHGAARGRSVLLFVFESLAFDESSLGDPAADRTPYLRQLAAQGPVAARARSQFAISSKSLYSILSGRYASPTMEILEAEAPHLDSLARTLGRAGYRTEFLSSQYLNWQANRVSFVSMGFETVIGAEELVARAAHTPVGNSWGIDDRELLPAIDALPRDKPFFAAVFNAGSHHPYWTPDIDTSKSDHARYRDAIRFGDSMLKAIAERLPKGTVIAVVGDHGEHFRDDAFQTRGCSLRDDEHMVPLVISAPGLGSVAAQGVRQIDLAPTLLDLLGVAPDAPVQGRSLLEPQPAPAAYMNAYGECHASALVEGDRKQIFDSRLQRAWRVEPGREDAPVFLDEAAAKPLSLRLASCAQYNERALRSLVLH